MEEGFKDILTTLDIIDSIRRVTKVDMPIVKFNEIGTSEEGKNVVGTCQLHGSHYISFFEGKGSELDTILHEMSHYIQLKRTGKTSHRDNFWKLFHEIRSIII